jgi:hypothetical protein
VGIQHAPPPAILRRLLTAKGQLIGASGANTPVAIPAGAEGRILRARTAEANGLAWEDPAFAASVITSGTLPVARGGTGLSALGTANQVLRVNAGGDALEFADPAGGGVDGSGTAGHVATWSDADTLTSVGGTTTGHLLRWNGTAWASGAPSDLAFARMHGTAVLDRFYVPDSTVTSNTATIGANVIVGRFLAIGRRCRVTEFGAEVTTLGAGSKARIGLYTVVDGIPDTLVAESGELDCSSTGVKSGIATATNIEPGVYLIAIHVGTASAVFRTLQAIVSSVSTSAFGTTSNALFVSGIAYGSLPATFPSGFSSLATNPVVLGVKLADWA